MTRTQDGPTGPTQGTTSRATRAERLPDASPTGRRSKAAAPVTPPPRPPRSVEGRLARLHLRGGMIALARAALEHMAGIGTLDREALVDLAEARWRSGDLEGAAEAAEAHLAAGGEEPIASLIVAEQAEREGRILDARQLATQVQGRLGEGLERLFAGEPRSTVWPPPVASWMDATALRPGRWGLLVGGAEVVDPDASTWPSVPIEGLEDRPLRAGALARPVVTDPPALPASPVGGTRSVEASREADQQLQAAEHDLERNDLVTLSGRLGLLLRADPALASVILSIADHALEVTAERSAEAAPPGERTPAGPMALPGSVTGVAPLQLLRGDILRALGREAEATDAYQEALHALPGRALTMESS